MSGLSATYISNKLAAEGISAQTQQLILAFLNNASSAEEIAGIEPQEGPVYDDPDKGFGDQSGDYDIGLTVAQRIIDKRNTLAGGFTDLTELSGISHFAEDKFDDLLYSFRVGAECSEAFEVNVKCFGAVGDGIHDDGLAIELAIKAVLAAEQILPSSSYVDQRVLGGTVVFPPGKYRVTQPIELKKDNITLRGSGQGSTLIEYEGHANDPYVFYVLSDGQTRRTVHFEDLTFSKGGIWFDELVQHHSSVRRCVFVGTEDYAIRTQKQMITFEVQDSLFKSCRGGIFIDGPSSDLIRISQCSFLYNKDYDIHIGSTTVWVEHCDFEIRPFGYRQTADAFIFIEPRIADEGGSGFGLLFNNRFGSETTFQQPGHVDFNPEVHGGPPRYVIRVGDDNSPANAFCNYCQMVGNMFLSKNPRMDLYERFAHIKITRNISYWSLRGNYFDTVKPDGAVIEEPNYAPLHVTAQSNAFLDNQVVTRHPVFSKGGLGWPMVDGDAQQNVWRKNAPQPQYTDSNVLSRDLSDSAHWAVTHCSVARNAESPSGMLDDAFTVTKTINTSSAALTFLTPPVGDDGPWCFSVWLKTNDIKTVRLGVQSVEPVPNGTPIIEFVTRQYESFTRTVGEWHHIYVVVGCLPVGKQANCIIVLGGVGGDDEVQSPGEDEAASVTGTCVLWDPRFEKGTRPQQRWIQPAHLLDPILPTDGEMWIHDDNAGIRQLRVQLKGDVYKVDLTPV